jgi:hypothetical protein
MGALSEELNHALRLAGGGLGPTQHRAVFWLQEAIRSPGKNYGVARLLDAVEGRMPAGAPPMSGALVQAIQKLIAKLGRRYAVRGHQQYDATTGTWRPFRTMRGDIFVRTPTSDPHRILMEGPGGPLWQQAVDAFADIKAMPPKNVERVFELQREQLLGNEREVRHGGERQPAEASRRSAGGVRSRARGGREAV